MSFKAFVWAWDQDVPNADYQHVLLALANIAPVRKVRASVNYISKQVKRSPRKVRTALAWLEGAGLITREERPGKTDVITLAVPLEFRVTMDADEEEERETAPRGRPKTPAKPLLNPCTPCAVGPIEPIEPKEAIASYGSRGSRLPDGWEPEPNIAILIGLTESQAADQLERFRDYWSAQPGAKGRKSDWTATWRNWCRTAMERSNGRGGATRPAVVDYAAERYAARVEAVVSGIKEAADGGGRQRWRL